MTKLVGCCYAFSEVLKKSVQMPLFTRFSQYLIPVVFALVAWHIGKLSHPEPQNPVEHTHTHIY